MSARDQRGLRKGSACASLRSSAWSGRRAASACRTTLFWLGLFLGAQAAADDTEIYRLEVDTETSRPKVLIVFDDSGSMDTNVVGERAPYDPNTTYPTVSGIQAGRLYWATGTSGQPPSANTSQWFNAQKNRCASSYAPLTNTGFYSGNFARWDSNNSDSWSDLSTSAKDPLHIECGQDVSGQVTDNGSGTGSPGAGYPRSRNPRPYGADRQSRVANRWDPYRIYTANYMNWYRGTPVPATRTRLEVAQNVISNIVSANTGIDFGLAVFNRNYDSNYRGSSAYDGARVVQRIIENMTATDRANLVGVVNGLEHEGSTPICESVYEAYRYLSGGDVLYGQEKHSSDVPGRDVAAESGSKYVSPMGDCQYAYIILMTDGEPQYDTDANDRIKSLTGKTCKKYRNASNAGDIENCLPELAEYMYNTDLDGDPANGEQKGILYTIGFATNQQLLQDAATKGGGLYYTADNAEQLTAAFQGALTSILATRSTFTSPAVATNNFTRTETRNEVFFAMFEPANGTNWPGNIKKLSINPANGVLLDRNGNPALNAATGDLLDAAATYWGSDAGDGGEVEAGGVGGVLAARDPDTRVIKTNTGKNNALQDFTVANLNRSAYGFDTDQALYDHFGVADAAEFADLLAWSRGWTSSAKTARREWMLGDILHSTPVVLDYGARSGYSLASPDLRIVAGTNAGFLHMFRNSDGAESWAIFPKELAPMLRERKNDLAGGATVYGVDGEVAFYRHDDDRDGTISGAGDKMYIFFGLRRGGSTYYALDVTDPDSPRFMWQVSPATNGFSELGETWSTPVVTTIPGHADGEGKPKPVLIFGAGYDPANDDRLTTAAEVADVQGRGVFIVDAATGALLWRATPASSSETNLQVSGMVHSIAASVSVRDSNGDGLTDRIYAADVGGNVWRIDLPGAARSSWRVVKFAALAGDGHAGDRRFFNKVDSVSTRDGSQVFDAVLIGSGDRTNPNATDNDDRFYMLKDLRTVPYTTDADCSDASTDPRCSLPITNADLFDATDNVLQEGTEDQQEDGAEDLREASGWYIDLSNGDGEKALSESVTLGGRVVFNTFSPDTSSGTVNSCMPTPGIARLYVVKLQNATATIDFTNNNVFDKADRFLTIGSSIADVPGIHVSGDGTVRLILPPGSGGGGSGLGGCVGAACNPGPTPPDCQGLTCIPPVPVRTYWHD